MNPKHTETSIKISEESHTGIKLFIPYCDTQCCLRIGSPHWDKLSAQGEGESHLGRFRPKPRRSTVPAAMTPPSRSEPRDERVTPRRPLSAIITNGVVRAEAKPTRRVV
jgi:hypothetical protein